MKTQQSLHSAKTALREAQKNTNDFIVSLSTKKRSTATESILKSQKDIFDRISEAINQLTVIETLVTDNNRILLDHRDLLKKAYNYTPIKYLDRIDDSKITKQMHELWTYMNTTDHSSYKLMVSRLSPASIDGKPANGYLKTFHLPTTVPDIIEQVGEEFGAGEYQIRIVDDSGKNIKSKTFIVAKGLPKLGKERENPDE